MRLISLELESKLRDKGLWPQSWVAWAALYVLALDLLLFALQSLTRHARPSISDSLEVWVTFLSGLAIVSARNLRLPVAAGKPAVAAAESPHRYLCLHRSDSRLSVGRDLAPHALSFRRAVCQLRCDFRHHDSSARHGVREPDHRAPSIHSHFGGRETQCGTCRRISIASPRVGTAAAVCLAWQPAAAVLFRSGRRGSVQRSRLRESGFREIVRDHGALYLRTATVVGAEPESLRVISSEPLDKGLLEKIAAELGEITLLQPKASAAASGAEDKSTQGILISSGAPVSSDGRQFEPTFTAGAIPAASNAADREIIFGAQLLIVDWASATGQPQRTGALGVHTRPSVLYARLFAALGSYAQVLETFADRSDCVRNHRTVGIVHWYQTHAQHHWSGRQLYEATQHVNRGDFSHRITVKSADQLATLANSFNSMTTSIEKLVQEQKEKQRLEGELAIAQEVQAQLYPKLITQLDTLEVHGFCRPARTVSGDYYDFLALSSDRLMLAVAISAAREFRRRC